MNTKRWLGFALIFVGFAILVFANYEKQQIAKAGDKAYEQIDEADKHLKGNPVERAVGGVFTNSLRKKAASGIAYYTKLVHWMMLGGVVVIAAGAGIALFASSKNRPSKDKKTISKKRKR